MIDLSEAVLAVSPKSSADHSSIWTWVLSGVIVVVGLAVIYMTRRKR